jgi:hypothetical protein
VEEVVDLHRRIILLVVLVVVDQVLIHLIQGELLVQLIQDLEVEVEVELLELRQEAQE